MKAFMALLRLQLLSRYADLKPKNLLTQLAEKRGRTVARLIGMVVLIIYLGVILFIVETKMMDILEKMGMPEMLVTLGVAVNMLGTLIMSFFFVMSSLYLGRDAAYLAALPLKPRTILSAKLTQVWVSETAISAILLLPASVLYATRTGAGVGFFLRLIPVWLLISVIPIALISLISTVLIRMSVLWKHRELLTTVSGIVFLVAYMFLSMNIGRLTGNSAEGGEMLEKFMQSYSTRIDSMAAMFPPAGWAAKGLLGDGKMLLLFTGVSLASAALVIWLLGMVYRKLSLLQTETPVSTRKRDLTREKFNGSSAFKACCLREIRTILRVPSYATNILPISFMPLLMVIMMGILGGQIADTGEGNMEAVLQNIGDSAIVLGILTAVMCYLGGMNPALSTAVSREGKGHDLMKSLPIPTKTIILSKLAVGFGLSALGMIAATVAMVVILPSFLICAIMAFALSTLFCYANAAVALSRDIKKPRLDWVTEQEAVKQNFGVLISMLISWALLVTLGVLSYFLLTNGIGLVPYFAILAAILAGVCVLAHLHLMKTARRYYCQG